MSDQTENERASHPGTDATPPEDSTIPDSETGVAAGYTGEPSTFEPEEDAPTEDPANGGPDAAADSEEAAGTGRRSREAQGMDHEELAVFQSHWDDFPGHTD